MSVVSALSPETVVPSYLHQSPPAASNPHWSLCQWTGSLQGRVNRVIPLLVHGLGGCTAWLDEFATALLPEFGTVYGLDLHAYGRHNSRIGRIDRYQDLARHVADAADFLYTVTSQPVLLIGLSLGGLVATHAVADYRSAPWAGLVLLSPAFGPAASSFQPMFYLKVFYRALLENVCHLPVKPLPMPYRMEAITSRADSRERLHQAVDTIQALTAGSYLELLKMTLSPLPLEQLTLPLLLMRAREDFICDTGKMARAYQRFASSCKAEVVFDNVRHDLTLEPIISEMADHLSHWLSRWCPVQ